MSVIGQGVIEVSADSTKLKAGIEDAKRSIKSLGIASTDATGKASASIDRYVQKLQLQAETQGKSTRETELYRLALRGASSAQLQSADSALKLAESYQRGVALGERLRLGFIAIGAAAATGLVAAAVSFDNLVKKAGNFQDLAEKTGDTAENIASLAVAAGTAGASMESISGASQKLTKNLTGVDDESKTAGAALTALGLNIEDFKKLAPADQFEKIGKSLNGFQDGAQKTAVAIALFGKAGAELLPFLKEIGTEGTRQVILTQKQIQLADEYSDSQARLKTQLGLTAQSIATDLIPLVSEFSGTIGALAKDQEFAATASGILDAALRGAINVFQTIAVLGSDVVFVFKGVGREIGAIAAQLIALATLDFRGFSAISDAVTDDAKRARVELDRFQKAVLSIGNGAPLDDEARRRRGRGPDKEAGKPELRFGGPVKNGKDTAGAEAKAQLAFDLDQIKNAADSLGKAYSNAEKIMEARRAAALVSERDYYASKLGFLNLNSAAQEDALKKEIARLQAEKLSGKDRTDNARKIADAESKLAQIRQSTAANIEVLGIQQQASLDAVERSYVDARIAAQSFLDVTERARQLENDSLGQGNKRRDFSAGISQINERYEQQRQDLQRDNRNGKFEGRQADLQRELALIEEFNQKSIASYSRQFTEREQIEGDFYKGASEGLRNYFDESQNVFKQTEQLVTNAFKGMEDALVGFVKTGKLDFKSLADSIITDLIRIQVKQTIAGVASQGGIFQSIVGGIAGLFSGGGGGAVPGGGRAIGGPVSAGGLYQVNERGPELLNVGGKQYLMMGGQSGDVTPNGGAGGVNVNVNVDASGTKADGNNERSSELGRRIGSSVRAILLQEKMPGGLLA